jgi:hypothetical protein
MKFIPNPMIIPLKRTLFITILLLIGLVSFSQEVQFAPAVISSGGSSNSGNSVNLSRWRIGQINVVTFPSENALLQPSVITTTLSIESSTEWSASIYPNPVNSVLKVRFDLESKGEFAFEIFDVTGRKLISQNARQILPGQVAELDLTGLTPAMYLLKIIPSEEGVQKQFKITKQ